jgi:putative colanic acid biosynthesis acetyltransferase WcaF
MAQTMHILDARITNPRRGGPSFSFGNRFYRVIWNLAWALLASWTPPFLHGWRRQILRLFGARIHSTAVIYPSARIWYPPNLSMAEHSCLGRQVTCYSMAEITIGAYAIVSQGAHLCAGTHDIHDQNFQLRTKPIIIGPNAWIAAEAFVGPGVTIGEGAVLGARGVAFKNLAPWTIYSGNPVRPIKKRRH